MSEGRRRLKDDAIRWAFEQWRASHRHLPEGGSLDEFFSRKHRGAPHALRRALARAANPHLPDRVRELARQDAERLRKELGDAA